VTTTSIGYRLDASADTLDLPRFRELSERGIAAAGGDHAAATDLLAAALALWRGSPLDGVASTSCRPKTCRRWSRKRWRCGNSGPSYGSNSGRRRRPSCNG
jgi:hypothetical protein